LTPETEFAIRADIWVQLSLGSGLALALGMIYMIIEEAYLIRVVLITGQFLEPMLRSSGK